MNCHNNTFFSKPQLAAITMLFFLCTVYPGWTAEPLHISLAVYKNGLYVKPFDGKIIITERPLPFNVYIENVSNASVRIYKKAMAEPESAILIEITNEKGQRTIIKRKKKRLSSDTVGFFYLSPGESKVIEMLIDPDKWEGLPILEEGKATQFTVRVIFDNDNRKVYSDYYDVLFEEGA